MPARSSIRRRLLLVLLVAACAIGGFLLASRRSPAPAPAPAVALTREGGIAPSSPLLPGAGAPVPVAAPIAAPGGDQAEPEPGLSEAPVYLARAEGEWDGMLVNTTTQALCDTSARCGLAMACHQGRCGGCAADDECAGGEACVLDHCVPRAAVECRSRTDCGDDEALCVLTGYSADPRGNAAMRAVCRSARGGTEAAVVEPVAGEPASAAEVEPQALLAAVEADARAALADDQ